MKVEVIALRDFPYAGSQPDEIKRATKGDTVSVNLTIARAWRDSGKVRFDEPAEKPAAEKPARKPAT